MQIANPRLTNHTLSITIKDISGNINWMFTVVYGPQGDLEKRLFIRELRQLKHGALNNWLIMGDFNLILRVQDKNNQRINRPMLNRFRRALDHLEVKEIDLVGKKFTWSNNQASPTLTRIDIAFYTAA
jgi:hypothetical protein